MAIVLALLGLGLVVGAPPALAFSCTLDGHTATATVEPSDSGAATVTRNATNLLFSGQDCGPLDQVDKLTVDTANINGTFGVDLRNGPLGPGFKVEDDGTSEIEITFTNVNQFAVFSLLGSGGDDDITLGQRLVPLIFVFEQQVNLNAGDEETSPDVDVTYRGGEFMGYGPVGGNDRVRGTGIGTPRSNATGLPIRYGDGPGHDTFVGGAGDDSFESTVFGIGDSFSGGGGLDILDERNRSDGLRIDLNGLPDDGANCPGPGCEGDNAAPDVEGIVTGSGSDTLIGGPGDERMTPGPGVNSVFAGAGDDLIVTSSPDADTLHGGTGTDGVSYYFHQDPVTVTLDGKPNDGAVGEGDNVFPDVESVEGTLGNDVIRGSSKNNRLFGNTGDDKLFGLGGNDVLHGGQGLNGFFFPSDGSDSFHGGPGTDTVVESNLSGNLALSIDGIANDRALGDPSQGVDNIGTDVENVVAGPGNDVIRGSPASNRLTGGPGNDDLRGGLGNDVLVPGAGDDSLFGSDGRDTAAFADSAAGVTSDLLAGTASGDGSDTLNAIEALVGSLHGDHLVGSLHADRLMGGRGDDTLKGLPGNDRLLGGAGDDNLNGGPGTDTCTQGPGSGPRTACEH